LPRLRRASGDDVIKLLGEFGFQAVAQRGSHIRMRRVTPDGKTQVLTVPRHRELDTGTLRAIIRQASRFVPEESLREAFYTD
jgi:predicted RNA binding protein YcfA (HicA-like mRNA interferase family)